MKKILLLTFTLFISLQLNGCVLFHGYAPPVQQGNVINQSKLNQLHRGLSQRAVENIMGSPVYVNTFSDNTLVYIYTYQPSYKPMRKQQVKIFFRRGQVVKIQKDLPPVPLPKAKYHHVYH